MAMKLVFYAIDWVLSRLWFSDIAVALLGIFIFIGILERLTNKGPMLWPVMGIIPSLFFHINDIYNWVTTAVIKTGGSFHYKGMWMDGHYGIVTADPSNVEYILQTSFKNFPKGKHFREVFHDLLGDGIFNVDGELWKEQRRIATAELHASQFVEYFFKTMEDLVHQKLLKLLEKLSNSGDFIDLQEVLLRFSFDNICITAFGVDPECLALNLPKVPIAKAFDEATALSLFRFFVPHFVWKPMRFFGVGFEKRLNEAIQIVHDFAEKTVMDRRIELSKVNIGKADVGSNLLSRLIEIENPDKQGQESTHFSNCHLKDLCIDFILPGRASSAVALAWFFWLIHKNPKVESKILNEINEILSQHRNYSKKEDPIDIVFTMEELNKMVYLQSALSESLRLYPPIPFQFREALEDDVLPDGSAVKKGAGIFFSIFSMARMEFIWGKDCLEYKPERWINIDGKFVMSENQFKYVVFNGGPRSCLGKKIAYMQMKMVAASILLRYKVKVVEGQNIVPKIAATLYMKNGLSVTFERRSRLNMQ